MARPRPIRAISPASLAAVLLLIAFSVITSLGLARMLRNDHRTTRAFEVIATLPAPDAGTAQHQIQLDSFRGKVAGCLGRPGWLGMRHGAVSDRIDRFAGEAFDQGALNQIVDEARASCAGAVLREVALVRPAAAAALGRLAHQYGMPVPPRYLDPSADLAALGDITSSHLQ